MGNIKIKQLVARAEKGDINTAFQLHEYYLAGKYVEQDNEKAEYFISLALGFFEKQHIRFSSLDIVNFRSCNRLKMSFNASPGQVIIGNNGAGKTSILDTLSYSLSWLVTRIIHNGGRGTLINKRDITLGNRDGYCSVITRFKLTKDYSADIELCEVEAGSAIKKKSHFADVTLLGKLYKKAVMLPTY